MADTFENNSDVLASEKTSSTPGGEVVSEPVDEQDGFEDNAVKEAEAEESENTSSDFEVEDEAEEDMDIGEFVDEEE